MKRKNVPLRVRIVDQVLTIEIGIDTLKNAAEHHEDFWLCETNKYAMVVSNPAQFAKDIKHELDREGEDGSTPLHQLLDKAIEEAANNGGEGLDHDAMDALRDAEHIAATT